MQPNQPTQPDPRQSQSVPEPVQPQQPVPEQLPYYQAPAPSEPSVAVPAENFAQQVPVQSLGQVAVEQPLQSQEQLPAQHIPATLTQQQLPTELPGPEPVQWQAVEYIQHDKTPFWYLGFAAVVVALMVLAILLMRTWTFAILIPVMAVALMIYSHRPPRELSYALSDKGLFINDQLHPMGEFKSFGVIQETDLHALMLIPVKRFRPGTTVYFPTEAGEQIVDILGGYLPMQDLHLDAFDKIIRKLRI